MINNRIENYAALILRLTLGALFLAHAGVKLFIFTPAGTAQFFTSLGLPPAFAYLTIAWELSVAIALVVGFRTRVAALAGTATLLGSIISVHGSAGFLFTNPNGGWEFPALWIITLVTLAILGDGARIKEPTPDLKMNHKT
ncbi:DoxX family protein [Pseudomonas veronii]|uniref:DoxX family protein n=1 Tax=Pseudomonas veronii TaxID=76761 RepID=UPI0009A53F1F|nr:DoxX family protein [Pseudomonas veronii]AQY65642.1 hypothetical protein PverR02_11430 [Pseudomonas veronii]